MSTLTTWSPAGGLHSVGLRLLTCEIMHDQHECYEWFPSSLVHKHLVDQYTYDDRSPITAVTPPPISDHVACFNGDKQNRPIRPIPFSNGFVRIVEYDNDTSGEVHARLLTVCGINTRFLRRRSERLALPSKKKKYHPVMDLTTVEEWTKDLVESPDYKQLSDIVTLRFEEFVTRHAATAAGEHALEEEEECKLVICVLLFRKIVPRRYIDCCFETGKLFCYALEAIKIVRKPYATETEKI